MVEWLRENVDRFDAADDDDDVEWLRDNLDLFEDEDDADDEEEDCELDKDDADERDAWTVPRS